MDLVPSIEAFAENVLEAYHTVKANVLHWCVSKEPHKQRGTGSGYHMAVKCNRSHRWMSIANWLRASRDLHVNFSETHVNYYSAYSYAIKEDTFPLHSESHPDLVNGLPPCTTRASQARIRSSATEKSGGQADDVESTSD